MTSTAQKLESMEQIVGMEEDRRLVAWKRPHSSVVSVDGCLSQRLVLENMAFCSDDSLKRLTVSEYSIAADATAMETM